METKTKDMKLFHKLVRNNRKKGTDAITELTANGISLQILYFDLEFEVAVLISLVHTFNFGFALKIALFDEEVIAADFMISQILSIFSAIGIRRRILKENSPAKSSRKHLRSPSDKIVYRF
jgi:hypothetical protein